MYNRGTLITRDDDSINIYFKNTDEKLGGGNQDNPGNPDNTILDNVNKEMTTSLNKRINDRSSILIDTQNDINSYISSKNQIDFNNNMLINKLMDH